MRLACAFLLSLLAVSPLGAQEWPARAVRIIVPFPPGGSADLMPRALAEKLAGKWQPVIVENRPGAAGNIGAEAVYRAEPDGYTLLSAPPPPLVINRLLYRKLSYDSSQFVEMMCDNLGVSLPHVRAGKLKALAVASAKRVKALPDVPALAETLPGFEAVAWFGVVAPPRTAPAIAAKVAAAVQDALKLPDVQKRLAELSAEPLGLTPAETAAYMKQETQRWAAVIRSARVQAD